MAGPPRTPEPPPPSGGSVAQPYDWAADPCPSCGSQRWTIQCRCLQNDRLCQRCAQWSHVDAHGRRVLGRVHGN